MLRGFLSNFIDKVLSNHAGLMQPKSPGRVLYDNGKATSTHVHRWGGGGHLAGDKSLGGVGGQNG